MSMAPDLAACSSCTFARNSLMQLKSKAACCTLALAALWVSGCQTLPQPPKVVTKVVTEYRELPAWATEQVANAPPVDQSVRAITESNNRRGETLDYVNCRSRLLAKLGKGEEVSPGECKK